MTAIVISVPSLSMPLLIRIAILATTAFATLFLVANRIWFYGLREN